MKLLVIGNGLLGSNIVKEAKEEYRVYSTYFSEEKDLEGKQFRLDVRNKEDVLSVFSKVEPDYVVHTAAMHDVDGCEKNPEKSYKINLEGTKNVLEAIKEFGSRLAFVSTDYVFDGKEEKRYTEEDEPNPLSVYGEHKLEAEKMVLEEDELAVRPSVIYGLIRSNFVTWALGELREGNELDIVDDQYSNPTYARDLARIIFELIEKDSRGLYHTTGSKCLNRYEFTKEIAEVFGYNESLISPIKTKELGQLAERPKKCCVSVKKLKNKINREPLNPKEGLRDMKNRMRD